VAIRFKSSDGGEDPLLSQINTTPLVDVMLVLLIIFLITIPAVNTSVAVALPKQTNQMRETRPENIVISVDPSGATYWADTRLPDAQTLQSRLKAASTQSPQPEVHIRGDARASYDAIGRIVYACQQAGITRIGFITEPPATSPR
jgi:biopolymer transport protein ExbD